MIMVERFRLSLLSYFIFYTPHENFNILRYNFYFFKNIFILFSGL